MQIADCGRPSPTIPAGHLDPMDAKLFSAVVIVVARDAGFDTRRSDGLGYGTLVGGDRNLLWASNTPISVSPARVIFGSPKVR
jgi:hypothetical protein